MQKIISETFSRKYDFQIYCDCLLPNFLTNHCLKYFSWSLNISSADTNLTSRKSNGSLRFFKRCHELAEKRCKKYIDTAKKIKISVRDFFSKCEQMRRKLRVCYHLLQKILMKTSFFV